MLGFPVHLTPTKDDLDARGRILAFQPSTQVWEPVSLEALTNPAGGYRFWMRMPAVPLLEDHELAPPELIAEPYPDHGALRLVRGVRVTHVATGLSLAYGSARSEAENRQRAKAALTYVLDTLTQGEGERHLLEDSLGQALALVLLIAEATKSPLPQLIDQRQRKVLAAVTSDVARALPYFDAQGVWEGVAELFGQLVDVATGGGAEPLREALLERLPRDEVVAETAGDKSRELLRLLAGGELGRMLEGIEPVRSPVEASPEEIVAALDSADAETIHELLVSRLPVNDVWAASLADLLAIVVQAGVEDRDQRGVSLTPERLAELMTLDGLEGMGQGFEYSEQVKAEVRAFLQMLPGYDSWKKDQSQARLQSILEHLGCILMMFSPTLQALDTVRAPESMVDMAPAMEKPEEETAVAEETVEAPGFGEAETEGVAVAPLPSTTSPEVTGIAESLLAGLPEIPEIPEFGLGEDDASNAVETVSDEDDDGYVEHGFGFGDAPIAKGGDDEEEEGGSEDGAIDQALTPSKGSTNAAATEVPEFMF